MERITMEHVGIRVMNVNRRLEMRGAKNRVDVEQRNGHVCLDELVELDGKWIPNSTIQCGTKREIADGLWFMMRGIDYASTKA